MIMTTMLRLRGGGIGGHNKHPTDEIMLDATSPSVIEESRGEEQQPVTEQELRGWYSFGAGTPS